MGPLVLHNLGLSLSFFSLHNVSPNCILLYIPIANALFYIRLVRDRNSREEKHKCTAANAVVTVRSSVTDDQSTVAVCCRRATLPV